MPANLNHWGKVFQNRDQPGTGYVYSLVTHAAIPWGHGRRGGPRRYLLPWIEKSRRHKPGARRFPDHPRGTMADPLNAFCDEAVRAEGAASGPLAGLNFAAKDVFDIAGHATGAGNPDWLRTHPPAVVTASAVQRLLDAGASLAGKTITDELTFSLNGENVHHGTPVNPNAPGRVAGGSSSGSAVAVAGGQVDFALGTDTGGSVRLPASNCGIFGFRPSHGSVPGDGVVPLAPSFDTVGWFTRDAGLLERVGQALLPATTSDHRSFRLRVASDSLNLAKVSARRAIGRAMEALGRALPDGGSLALFEEDANDWLNAFRTIQGIEAWRCHGEWIRKSRPRLGRDIEARFAWAASLDPADLPEARAIREKARQRLEHVLGDECLLCLPTTPDIALRRRSTGSELERFRQRALTLLCPAGLAGLPQVSLPMLRHRGCPLGISLVGPRGSDRSLLALVGKLAIKPAP
jgi:amidase